MAKAKGPKHPALTMWTIAKILLILALVLCIFACFYPAWSRIKGTGIPTGELGSYVGTVTDASKLYMGHWSWELDYEDSENTKLSADVNDSTGPPTFGHSKCRDYLNASRITGLCGIGLLFLSLICCILTEGKLKKWAAWYQGLTPSTKPWKAPMGPAALAWLCGLLGIGCTAASWACWLVLGEHSCRAEGTSWNPFQGYSYSFICMCCACGLATIATLLMCLGLTKLKKAPKAVDEDVQFEVVPVDDYAGGYEYPPAPAYKAAEPPMPHYPTPDYTPHQRAYPNYPPVPQGPIDRYTYPY